MVPDHMECILREVALVLQDVIEILVQQEVSASKGLNFEPTHFVVAP